jgi:hypothetical protein
MILASTLAVSSAVAAGPKPHAVLVIGTLHYSPELTMPLFARELERFGFRTTVIRGEGDPEKRTEQVLPGIEALAEANVGVSFVDLYHPTRQLMADSTAPKLTTNGIHLNAYGYWLLADSPQTRWHPASPGRCGLMPNPKRRKAGA